jgi:hypothetical protein
VLLKLPFEAWYPSGRLFSHPIFLFCSVALDSIVTTSQEQLIECFLEANPVSVSVAFCLLEALQEQEVVNLQMCVYRSLPAVSSDEAVFTLEKLIDKNILTRPTINLVSLHTRSLKLAFKNLKAQEDFALGLARKLKGIEFKDGMTVNFKKKI